MCDYPECPTLWCRTPHMSHQGLYFGRLYFVRLNSARLVVASARRVGSFVYNAVVLNSGVYRLKFLSQICVILNRLVFYF